MNRAWAIFHNGDTERTLAELETAAKRELGAGRRHIALALLLERGNYELVLGIEGTAERQRARVDEAIPVMEAAGDDWALMLAYASDTILGEFEDASCAEMLAGIERFIELARRVQDSLWVAWGETSITTFQYFGATPVDECLRWLEGHPHVDRHLGASARIRLLATIGRFEEAHELLERAAERAAEMGSVRSRLRLAWRRFDVARLEGDWPAAEEAARELPEASRTSEPANYLLYTTFLAEALVELERKPEAIALIDEAEQEMPSEEPDAWVRSRCLRARVLAGEGRTDEAEQLARSAVERAETTDRLDLRGGAFLDLATVLAAAGKDPRPALEQALALFERKGNLVMAERTRARL